MSKEIVQLPSGNPSQAADLLYAVRGGNTDYQLTTGSVAALAYPYADAAVAVETAARAAAEALLAPIANPTFSGIATIPTAAIVTLSGNPNFSGFPTLSVSPSTGDSSTKIATTAYVQAQGYIKTNLVASVFGRTGAIVATSGDYSFSLISGVAAVAQYPTMVGDSGSGGTKGAVPAPGAGDAAAGKFLSAGGVWAVPSGSGVGLSSVGVSTNAAFLSVGSSPLTSNGTITVNLATGLTQNYVLATPNGSSGAVGLRALVAADIPALPYVAANNATLTGTTTIATAAITTLSGTPNFTGAATGQTATALDNSTKLATTAYADAAVAVEKTRALTAEALLAPTTNPNFTGTPLAPTATAGTSTTQIATTAFVQITKRDNIVVETSNCNMAAGDFAQCDTTTGSFTATLPDATTCQGRVVKAIKIDGTANTVTIATTAGQLINGQASYLPQITNTWQSLHFESDGSNWVIVGMTY